MSMPFDQISDIYYRKKCSIGATAAEIIDIYTSLGLSSEGEEAEAKVKKMAAKYPNIPEGHLYTLLQVVSTSSARAYSEISDILSKHFAKKPWTQRLDLSYRTTPLPDEELEGPLGALPSRSSSNASPRTPISGKPGGARATKSDPSSQVDLTQAIERISTSHQAKRETSAYASQLYRRGASNSLYRQAAVVYRERANEHCAAAHQLTSTAADLLVEQASTKTSIDLHGVTVRDGSRIAQEKARQWWDSLGEFRSRKAREQPLTIITGIGRHTTSGVSQLRQAVAATLLQDGWKMQVETGRFVLSGRR